MPKTIMVIDDEPDIRTYLMAILEDHGFATSTVTEDQDIIAAIRQQPPDMVLLDIMMPRRSGISVFRDLRRTEGLGHLPVALISGMEKTPELFGEPFEALFEDGDIRPPDGFIEKPIKVDRLVEVVKGLVENRGADRGAST